MNKKKMLLIGSGIGLLTVILSSITQKLIPTDKRDLAVKYIRGEIDNPNVDKYWQEVIGQSNSHPPHWCGALVLWALHMAGITKIPWKIGSGFIFESHLRQVPSSEKPKPGDVAYFTKFQHHAMVVGVSADGQMITTVDGNQERSSKFPEGAIKEITRPRSNITAIYSIESLLK